MRLLVAHNFYRWPGGEDFYVRSQLRLLQTAGFDAGALWFQSSDMSKFEAGLRTTSQLGKLRHIRNTLRATPPDVIHLHNPNPCIGLAGVRELARAAPIVMTLHNYRLRCPNGYFFTKGKICERCASSTTASAAILDCLGSQPQSTIYALGLGLERFLGPIERHVSLFVAPSEFMASRMTDLGVPDDRVRVIPPFHNLTPATPSSLGTNLLYVGRLANEKGVATLLEAAGSVGAPTVIVGDGPEMMNLAKQAPANVTFTGWLDDEAIGAQMRNARFLVVPSLWYENFPLVLLTAMAHGRPILASNAGSVGQIVKSRGVGTEFETGSPESLSATIRSLWNDHELLAEWSNRGQELATTEFTPQHHLALLKTAYDDARTIGTAT